jgi:hypothetical protein
MSPPTQTLLERLAAALVKQLGLEECQDAASLIALPQLRPRFVRPRLALRLARYYDFLSSAVIYDAGGGTLGLIENVLPGADVSAIRSPLDQAAAIRQLLLDQEELGSGAPPSGASHALAIQVELLLLTEAPTSEAESTLRKVLTDIARETGYVRLIGIGVLQPDSKGEFSEAALRRAFPWLLKATSKWFLRPDYAAAAKPWRKPGESIELRLRDYRIAGTRRLRCDGKCNLQIVQGHNGSGKSALTEGLELLLTKGVQRITEGGSNDYFKTVRHRPEGTDDTRLSQMPAAEVSLWDGAAATAPVSSVSIMPDKMVRTGEQTDGQLTANSFRLDQTFMDRIVRNRPEQRILIFLEAFSPSDVTLLPKLRANRKAIKDGIAALPQQIAAGAPTEQTLLFKWVLDQFGWLGATDAATPQVQPAATPVDPSVRKSGLDAILPMPVDDLKELSPVDPSLAELVKVIETAAGREELIAALGRLDITIQTVLRQLPSITQDLRTALRVFEEFKTWKARTRVEAGDSFRIDLEAWLDAMAKHDLARKGRQILSVLNEAVRRSWRPPKEDAEAVRALEAESVRTYLETRLGDLGDDVKRTRARVQVWLDREQKEVQQETMPERSRRETLSDNEVAALNRAGKWLATTAAKDGLGDTFKTALRRSEQVPLAEATIGRSGGLDPAITEARRVISACDRLQSAMIEGAPGSSERLQKLTELVDAVQSAGVVSSQSPHSFFQILAGNQSAVLDDLIAAFNELLALMTPARWTYRDIQLGIDDNAIDMTTHEGARADLLFNTAELNAWTLALFLLLAPRLPNPLYLLVLDDPLQNMDELTVITVARALGRVTRVFPRGWLILALFHQESAVARILDETQATAFELPWMQPTSATSDEPIVPTQVPEKWPPDIQQLTARFLADIGRSAAGPGAVVRSP